MACFIISHLFTFIFQKSELEKCTSVILIVVHPCDQQWPTGGSSLKADKAESPPDPARVPWTLQPKVYYDVKVNFFNVTSERKLLRVGFTRSVLVIRTLEENAMSILVNCPLFSCKYFVCVWVVLQGRRQSETMLPSIRSSISIKHDKKHRMDYVFTGFLISDYLLSLIPLKHPRN